MGSLALTGRQWTFNHLHPKWRVTMRILILISAFLAAFTGGVDAARAGVVASVVASATVSEVRRAGVSAVPASVMPQAFAFVATISRAPLELPAAEILPVLGRLRV